MQANRLSSLTRPVDLNYATNKLIVIISSLFFLAILILQFVFQKASFFQGLDSGFNAGMSVFIAWAFAREIDPDSELSAFVAAFISALGFFFFPSPVLLILLLEILLLRLLNRSTGLPAKFLDLIILILLSSWISVKYSFIFGLSTTLVFFLDSFLPEPNRQSRIFGVIAIILTFFFTGISEGFSFLAAAGEKQIYLNSELNPELAELGLFMLITTFLFIPKILSSRKITSTGDVTGIPLSPLRVQTAQLMALLSAVIYAIIKDWKGFENLLPLWAAILGVSFYYLFIYLQRLLKK